MKDISMFQGIIEFKSPIGVMRAVQKGCGQFDIYLCVEDDFGRESYLYERSIWIHGKANPSRLWAEFTKKHGYY